MSRDGRCDRMRNEVNRRATGDGVETEILETLEHSSTEVQGNHTEPGGCLGRRYHRQLGMSEGGL